MSHGVTASAWRPRAGRAAARVDLDLLLSPCFLTFGRSCRPPDLRGRRSHQAGEEGRGGEHPSSEGALGRYPASWDGRFSSSQGGRVLS